MATVATQGLLASVQKIQKAYPNSKITHLKDDIYRIEIYGAAPGTTQLAGYKVYEAAPEVKMPTLEEVIEKDPWMALEEYRLKLEWEKWVTENQLKLNELFKRWTGKELDETALTGMASGANKALIQQYQKLVEYEKWRPTYHQYFGREPTITDIETVRGRFAAPQEYESYLTAGEKVKGMYPEVTELWQTEYGELAPEKEKLTRYLMGGEGWGDFQRKYEEARIRKTYRFKSKEATPGLQLTKAGVTMPTLADWQNW